MSRLAGRGLALAALGLAVFGMAACGQKDAPVPPAAAPAGPPPTPTLEQLKGATVSGVFDQAVTLANGKYDGPPAEPGAASHPTLMLWESAVAFGDMDGAPGNEAVALLSSNSGGSGEFVYIAVFGVRDGQLVNLGTAEVGDRVKLRTLWLEKGKAIMDVVEAGPKDPACCPTQLARKTYAMEGGALKQSKSEAMGTITIGTLAAVEWMLVSIDGQPVPAGLEAAGGAFRSQQRARLGRLQPVHGARQGNRTRRTPDRPGGGDEDGLPPGGNGARAEVPGPVRKSEPLHVRRRAARADRQGRHGRAALQQVARQARRRAGRRAGLRLRPLRFAVAFSSAANASCVYFAMLSTSGNAEPLAVKPMITWSS